MQYADSNNRIFATAITNSDLNKLGFLYNGWDYRLVCINLNKKKDL